MLASGQATGTAGVCAAGAQDRAIDSVFTQSSQSFAVFSQVTYSLSNTLAAIIGLRYTDDEKDGAVDVVINNVITGPAGLNLRVPETADLQFNDSAVTWLANLSWDISDNTMAFVSASTGYKVADSIQNPPVVICPPPGCANIDRKTFFHSRLGSSRQFRPLQR